MLVDKKSNTFDGMDLSVNHRRIIEIDYTITSGSVQLLRHPEISQDGSILIEASSELFLL